MSIKPKSVIILTGFLGSGKTTLLNAILRSKKEKRFAIIENEVGETGIDGELIIKNTDSFTELSNGCICCSLNSDFTETLKKLIHRNDWDELIIEATGVANPGGILTPFKQFPWVQKYFQSPVVISIVDAQNIEEQLQLSDTAASQIAYGDNVYISKKDTISNEHLKSTQKLIKRLNPLAACYAGDKNNVPVNDLLEKRKPLIPFIPAGNPFSIQEKEIHHDQFNSISLEYDSPFDENKLFARLYTFLMLQSANVYRFKGIFYDSENPNKLVIQSVMKNLFIEEGEPWKEGEVKTAKFVFIGKNLKKEGFDKMLKQCLR